jgi:translocation and assembly module TamB
MSNSPNHDTPPESENDKQDLTPTASGNSQSRSNRRFWLMMLTRGSMALGGIFVIGLVAGSWWLQKFIQKDLAPLAEKNLTNTLNRPVKLGAVKEFSLSGVRFGSSSIPATDTDSDNATVEAVDASFDIWQLIFQRRLKLDVTLVNPTLYVEQDSQGRWLDTQVQPPGQNAVIKTDLDKIRFRNGNLVLASSFTKLGLGQNSPQSPLNQVAFSQVNGVAQLLDNNQFIKYEVAGKPKNSGSIFARGTTRPKGEIHDANLQFEDIQASDIAKIVQMPIALQKGTLKGDVRVQAAGEETPLLFGDAIATGLQVQVGKMPYPFAKSQGKLSFDRTEIKLENVSSNYGKVALLANGIIDRKTGFKLAARVNSASAANVQETLKVKFPLPVMANFNADLLVTGDIDEPLVSGKVNAIASSKIDKVDFKSLTTKFAFATRAGLINFTDIQGQAVVGGEIGGTGQVRVGENPQVNFNLTAKNLPGDAIAKIYNATPNFQIGAVAATAQIAGVPGTGTSGSSSGNIQTAVKWQAPNGTYPGTGETIVNSDRSVTFRNVALNVAGGQVKAAGNWVNEKWQVTADTSGIPVKQFVNKEQTQDINLTGVTFDGRLLIAGSTAPFKIAGIQSENAGIDIGGGRVALSQVRFNEETFAAQLVANNVRLSRVLKESAPVLQNPLAGTFQIAGNRDNITLKTLQGRGNARLAVGGGTVAVNNIRLDQGAYQAQLQVNDSNVQELAQVPQQLQGKVTGDFQVAGTVDSFQLPAIQARGKARLDVGGGSFNAGNIVLDRGRYQAQVQASNVPLQRFAKIPPQVQGGLNGQFNVAGTVESFKPENIELTGQGRLNVAGGTVNATNIRLAKGRYQALVNASGVELNRVNNELEGQFGGNLQVAGNVNNLNLANLAAAGQVEFSQGLGGIQQPLTANVGWNGQRLVVEGAKSRDVTARGYVTANAKGEGFPVITGLNLDVNAKNYNLNKLSLNLPNGIKVTGKTDFIGKITGNLPVPNLQGQLALRNLAVHKFAFEPLLAGNITTERGRGIKLNVAGKQDRIAFNLDANNRPQDFSLRWQNAIATGQTQGENIIAKVDNFPITALNFSLPNNQFIGGGGVAGALSGNFQVNQKTLATTGNIAIVNPQVGRIKGNSLDAIFNYNQGKLTLKNSSFIKNNSRYAFVGSVIPTAKTPQIQGTFSVSQGDIQDVLTTLQIFEVADLGRGMGAKNFGTAADLSNTKPASLPDKTTLAQIPQLPPEKEPQDSKLLLFQLQRFVELVAISDKQQLQRRDASPIPDLADLKGIFNGEVTFDTATPSGLAADFKLNGQNFIWGRANDPNRYFVAQKIIAEGSFNDGIVRFQPLRVESKTRLLAFTGSLGGQEQSGTFRVTNFPIRYLSNFVKLPVGLTGNLSGQAAIAGSITNPQAQGDFNVSEGTLNTKGVQSADASFNYANGRLNFNSNVNVVGSDPVTIAGGIPYQSPLSPPTKDNQINLNVKVKNQGLAVLNLFTNQLTFENGEGEVDLQVKGTRDKLILNGIANLNKATFSAQALPGKLTDVTGQAKFDFDRIILENLEGKFSRGRIVASGEIPISNNELTIANPFTVSLDQLTLNLKSLYQGVVSGNLKITGSALDPLIGGDIKLSNGQVLLSESTDSKPQTSVSSINLLKSNQQPESETNNTSTKLNNLQLTLGNNVQVIRPPLLNFIATGSLNVTGSFAEPIPEGEIRLRSGGINLFTTRFKLAQGYKHKAIFRKSQPRDPDLDVQLFAKVLDGVQSSELSRSNTTGFVALESVRVEAKVKGASSQLNNNLELRSNPSRSENEIVALLGGGFVETQGRSGDSTLGLINIAGSAVFNNFQSTFNQIGDTLGLSEFRIFPTIISDNPEAGRNFSSLQLAAEAGVDISPRFSASALKIITASDPVQWGINYRINREFRVRASTNLFDDNRAVIEFERRF